MLKLDAVNQMLESINQTPVTTIVNNQHPDVLAAISTLNRIDKQVQSKGWWFNTDTNLTLAYNPLTDEVIVPGNTLGVDPIDPLVKYIQRGTRLYDPENSTFEIGKSVEVEIKVQLDFEDLPESAGIYIATRAERKFVANSTGDQNKLAELREDEKYALTELKKDDMRYIDLNVNTNPNVVAVTNGIRPAY